MVCRCVGAMWYVYIIRSDQFPRTGIRRRHRGFETAAAGSQCRQVHAHRQIQTVGIGLVLRFPDKYKALEFEKYLKSHSGRAFAKKRL